MRTTITRAVVLGACLCLSTLAVAHAVMLHYLSTVQFGPHGEVLVSGTMGSMLSTDGGGHWTPPVSPARPNLATATNSTERAWKPFGLEWAGKPASVPAVDRLGRLYACSKDRLRVEFSDDGGRTWKTTEALDKSDPGRQTIENGVSRIVDIDGRYRELRDTREIRGSADLDECSHVTMVADIPYVLASNGIYRSEDRGLHWSGHYHFLGAFPNTARLFGDGNGTLYVNQVSPNGDGRLRIYRSTDRGASWDRMVFNFPASELAGAMALLSVRDDALYFVSRANERGLVSLCRSGDGTTAVRLLDFQRSDNISLDGLDFFDIGAHGELGVLGSQSLFLSSDRGRRWRLIDRDGLMKASWVRDM